MAGLDACLRIYQLQALSKAPVVMLLKPPFGGNLGFEFDRVDHKAFMRALGDFVDAVVGLDVESELAPLDVFQAYFYRHGQPGRGGGEMAEVDVGADGLLAGPVQMRVDGLDAGPFAEPDHEAGGEHLRHLLEFRRLRGRVAAPSWFPEPGI